MSAKDIQIHCLGDQIINERTSRQFKNGPQNYCELLSKHSAKNQFQDPEFPHDETSIGTPFVVDVIDPSNPAKWKETWLSKGWNQKCEWMRIGDIVKSTISGKLTGNENIKFACGGSQQQNQNESGLGRLDIEQGALGDCWLLAALSTVACNPEFISIVVPDDNANSIEAGIFHFRFWFQGFWIDVVVDDYLPVVWLNDHTELELLGCSIGKVGNNVEIWVPLVEKAYAKLQGSYKKLAGGFSYWAFENLIGGLVEYQEFDCNEPQFKDPNCFFQDMKRNFLNNTFFACGNYSMVSGLCSGHAYSITFVTEIKINEETFQLVRIRNPYGKIEWNGDWCDGDCKWDKVSKEDKIKLGLQNQEDGEFWMSFQDIVRLFGWMDICYCVGLQSGYVQYFGEWSDEKENTACKNLEQWHKNPHITFNVNSNDQDRSKSTIIVQIGIVQSLQSNTGFEYGFKLFKVDENSEPQQAFDTEFFKTKVTDMTMYNKNKENCLSDDRLLLRVFTTVNPGKYIVMPYTTTQKLAKGKFYVRILHSKIQ